MLIKRHRDVISPAFGAGAGGLLIKEVSCSAPQGLCRQYSSTTPGMSTRITALQASSSPETNSSRSVGAEAKPQSIDQVLRAYNCLPTHFKARSMRHRPGPFPPIEFAKQNLD